MVIGVSTLKSFSENPMKCFDKDLEPLVSFWLDEFALLLELCFGGL